MELLLAFIIITEFGNYREKCPLRIWKRYLPLLIDLSISNNFSSVTFFCATRILRVIGRQSICLYDKPTNRIVTQPLSASTWGQLKYLRYCGSYISTLVNWYTLKNIYLCWHFIASSFTLRLFIHEITSS